MHDQFAYILLSAAVEATKGEGVAREQVAVSFGNKNNRNECSSIKIAHNVSKQNKAQQNFDTLVQSKTFHTHLIKWMF